jgi:hypothetical protein
MLSWKMRTADAFATVMTPHRGVVNQRSFSFTTTTTTTASTTTLNMTDEPLPLDRMGETERLLLERRRIQELGKTADRKDGWTGWPPSVGVEYLWYLQCGVSHHGHSHDGWYLFEFGRIWILLRQRQS